ncbi:MAG: hypothetical protein ABIF11_10845, partial [Nitrospirota bacterium]
FSFFIIYFTVYSCSQYEIFNWLNGYKGNWEITISLNCPAKDVGHAKLSRGDFLKLPLIPSTKRG